MPPSPIVGEGGGHKNAIGFQRKNSEIFREYDLRTPVVGRCTAHLGGDICCHFVRRSKAYWWLRAPIILAHSASWAELSWVSKFLYPTRYLRGHFRDAYVRSELDITRETCRWTQAEIWTWWRKLSDIFMYQKENRPQNENYWQNGNYHGCKPYAVEFYYANFLPFVRYSLTPFAN